MQPKIILASTSPFRKALLNKLCVPFTCEKPLTDESPLENETPEQLVSRLACLKAQAIANKISDAFIIGSDQVCIIDGEILGKPGNFENAVKQLKQASGKKITFLTGLTLINNTNGKMITETIVEPFIVHFRKLTTDMIHNYLKAEQPYNCAGSFKSEGLGISLFSKLEGDDPNTLIGLPLIKLIDLFSNQGIDLLAMVSKPN